MNAAAAVLGEEPHAHFRGLQGRRRGIEGERPALGYLAGQALDLGRMGAVVPAADEGAHQESGGEPIDEAGGEREHQGLLSRCMAEL